MSVKVKLLVLALASLLACTLFLFYDLGVNWEYAFNRRSIKIITIVTVACSIAYSSLVFQTITNNRILTPAIMGFEAVYLLFQTLIVFVYGDRSYKVLNESGNFLVSVALMLLFALVLYLLFFRKEGKNIHYLLLTGLVMGILFMTVGSFLQVLVHPNDFLSIQGKMFASFNKINYPILWYAIGVMILCFVLGVRYLKYLDVMALGRDNAVGLGVNYPSVVRFYLLSIAVLVAVSTALVGPLTFLGVMVCNLSYVLFKTYKHSVLLAGCCLIAILSLVLGQFVVEYVFNFSTTISIITNFVGGVFFLFLLLNTRNL
ncbi:MAG: iron chelate uptake ABC transporter family permease subunit [Flavihumibacter sp.]